MTTTPEDRGPWDADLDKIIADYSALESEHWDTIRTMMAEAWRFGYTTGMADAAKFEEALKAGGGTTHGELSWEYGHMTNEVGWVPEPRGEHYATSRRRVWRADPEWISGAPR